MAERIGTVDANRRFYAEHAAAYDGAEHCVAHERVRELLDGLLAHALEACDADAPRVLDACGGTGNASELLARRGVETTLVDVSPEMIDRWRVKAKHLGVAAVAVVAEIDAYLASEAGDWDLIVFSSALHHLDDPAAVAEIAFRQLAPGGVLLTAFDPISATDATTRRLRRFDYLLSLLADPRALRAALRRRRGDDVNVGDLAERHALEGIDDEVLAERLTGRGAEVIEHARYACQRYRGTDRIFRALGRSTTFHLIIRKPVVE